jgi:LacI family transcriptional regulator
LKARVRLADVAKASNVSVAAVSRILNEDETFSATDETRRRVQAAARELGYFPDLRAQNLRRRSSRIFAIYEWLVSSRNQLSQDVVAGVEERMRTHGHETFYRPRTGTHGYTNVLPWRVDGAIIMMLPSSDVLDVLRRHAIPYVCVNEMAEGSVGHVIPDEAQGVGLGVEHLLTLGHTKVAWANNKHAQKHFSHAQRRDALASILKGNGLAPRSLEVNVKEDEPAPLKALVDEGVTAVLAHNDRVAITVLRSAALLGLSVPEDLSVIAFDDVYPAKALYPSITTIGLDAREMGRRGAEMLLDNLDAAPESPCETIIPYYLTVRESSAPPKGGSA